MEPALQADSSRANFMNLPSFAAWVADVLSFCVPQTNDLDAPGPPGSSDRSVSLGMLSKDCEGPSSDEADDSAKSSSSEKDMEAVRAGASCLDEGPAACSDLQDGPCPQPEVDMMCKGSSVEDIA